MSRGSYPPATPRLKRSELTEPMSGFTKDLVSVVIPSYNRAHTVARAVDRVLEQNYPWIEVIVVDDESKDDTATVMAQYENDARVRYLKQENGGCCVARNYGIREARGEFVAMLDSDDYWLPGKLALEIQILKTHPEVSLVWTDMDAIDAADHVTSPRYLRKMYAAYRFFPKPLDLFDRELKTSDGVPYFIGDLTLPMLLGNLIHTSTVVARAESLKKAGEYDKSVTPSEDQDFYQRVCKTGPVAYVDTVTLHYLIGATDAITSPTQSAKLATSYLRVMDRILAREDRAQMKLASNIVHEAMADGHAWAGRAYFAQGEMAESRRHLLTALRMRPTNLRLAKYYLASLVPKPALNALRSLRSRRARH